jgi:hypothetical protein
MQTIPLPSKPRSENQRRASRENGARSRGPLTPQGKRNSARNAIRHGFRSRAAVLETESAAGFQTLLSAFMDEFRPTTPAQIALVNTLAISRWRQLRAWRAEKTALDLDPSRQSPAAPKACAPHLLLRYEIACEHQFNRALGKLLAPKPPVPNEPSKALKTLSSTPGFSGSSQPFPGSPSGTSSGPPAALRQEMI